MVGQRLVLLLCAMGLVLCACSKPYGHYKDDRMIGNVMSIDRDNRMLEVDISEWHKRDLRGDINDYGVSVHVRTDDLPIVDESGEAVALAAIKPGQKVELQPPRKDRQADYEAERMLVLEMTYAEKYARLLSHRKGAYRTTVYTDGEGLSPETESRLMELVSRSNTLSFSDYPRDYAVDYEQELGIERFPVMLVYDDRKLALMTYDVDELRQFFDRLSDQNE